MTFLSQLGNLGLFINPGIGGRSIEGFRDGKYDQDAGTAVGNHEDRSSCIL